MESKNKGFLPKLVENTYKTVISYIFFLIVLALLFLAAFSTCYVDSSENIYFLPDNPLLNVALFAATLVCAVLIARIAAGAGKDFLLRIDTDEVLFKKIRRVLLCTVWVILSLWAVSTQIYPRADQYLMFDVAKAIGERDFSAYSDVNYLYTFNHQIGLGLVEALVNKLVGEYNFVAYLLIYAALVPLIYRELSILGGYFGLDHSGQLIVIVLCILFSPLALYASFLYGTIPGLLLALLAIRYELKYFREGTWKEAVLAAVCISMATLLKSNYLIFMVAMFIYAIVEIFRSAKARKCFVLVLFALFYVLQAKVPVAILAEMRGADIPTGVSKWAWVTMGLQESANPGWYNSYTLDTLIDSDHDTETQKIWVKEDLKNRVEEFWQDKDMARDFFVRKTASQWNEPSFESMFILQGNKIGSGAQWPEKVITEQGNYALTNYLNYLNFVILAGTMLYLLLCSKSDGFRDSLIFPLTLIGGFLFHLVWEAKGQYTLPYFVLLLPCAVMGYTEAAGRIVRAGTALKNGESAFAIDRKALAVKLVLVVVAVLVLWYVFHGTLGSITGDTAEYMSYLAAHS